MPIKPSDIPVVSPGRDPGVTARPIRVDDPRGRAMGQQAAALQEFGRSLHGIANMAANFAEKRKGAEDGIGIDSRQLEVTKRLAAAEAEALNNPSDDPNFINDWDARVASIHQDVDTEFNESGQRLSEDGQRRWQQVSLNVRTNSAGRMGVAINNARVVKLTDQATTNIVATAKEAGATGDLDGALARVDATVDSVIDAVPFENRDKYRKAAHLQVYQMTVQGHTARADALAAAGDFAGAQAELEQAKAIVNKITGLAPTEASEEVPGMLQGGNIDLTDRPVVPLEDGKVATLKSITVEADGKFMLIPTIADGRVLNEVEAWNRARVTKEHLGVFETKEAANAYAKKLSQAQGALVDGKSPAGVAAVLIDRAKAHGVDPLVLLSIAWIESKLNPSAKNPKSSAAGVLQFISETGRQYGLPEDARRASVLQQGDAGARLTADGLKILKRELGSEPTPGETYLAHFLGVNGALGVLDADPATPLSRLLPAKVIAANPQLARWTAGDIQVWATEKMQGAMEYVTEAGFIDGRKVDAKAAQVPIDSAMSLYSHVAAAEDRQRKALEAHRKEFQVAIDPAKPRAERDPAGYVAKNDPRVSEAFNAAAEVQADLEATDEQKAEAWQGAVDTMIDAQERAGVPKNSIKALPNDAAKAEVDALKTAPGPQALDNFFALRARSGEHWPKIFGELVEQKLPETFQVYNLFDHRYDNAALLNAIAAGASQDEADLKKNLGTSIDVKADLLDPIEDALAPYAQAYADGYGADASGQFAGFIQAFKNAALVQANKTRDAAAAVKFVTEAMADRLEVVNGHNMNVILPKAELNNFSEADLERAADQAQLPDAIKAWNPAPFSDFGLDKDFDLPRTLSAATNPNETTWVTNQAGDGLVLLVHFTGSPVKQPLSRIGPDGEVEHYEVKFADVPRMAKERLAAIVSVERPEETVPRHPGVGGL
jgi:hypothetical protein